ncbi:MAG: PEP-CTERM sorting domain-containing protein [Gammaproteobacteria bacterium]|nr:PEP-CTERM sorting domain-containing protein [Gammaproteobacteria bacterium]MCF6259760.1 PEP-CTERM sorting domain-containing protein [Gammaproteobacteria bacterium]
MFKHLTAITLFAATSLGLSSQASATLILDTYASGSATPTTIGGYAMTDFAITNGMGGSTTNVMSPISGSLSFLDQNNSPLAMSRRLADDVNWWNNGETNDYDIYTTSNYLITILLPENTRAFSFSIGANLGSTSNNAWLTSTESNGLGIDNQYWFNVNRDNTPGFGIYADNSNGSCSTITSVTIDPEYWGVGNFSINQDRCATSVPEPSSVALLALGLLGFSLLRRKNNA